MIYKQQLSFICTILKQSENRIPDILIKDYHEASTVNYLTAPTLSAIQSVLSTLKPQVGSISKGDQETAHNSLCRLLHQKLRFFLLLPEHLINLVPGCCFLSSVHFPTKATSDRQEHLAPERFLDNCQGLFKLPNPQILSQNP